MTNHNMDDTLQSLIGNSRWPPTQNSVHHRSICNECFYGDQESKMVAAARHSIT